MRIPPSRPRENTFSHSLFLWSPYRDLYHQQLEVGGHCAHLVESVVVVASDKSPAVPRQAGEAA